MGKIPDYQDFQILAGDIEAAINNEAFNADSYYPSSLYADAKNINKMPRTSSAASQQSHLQHSSLASS